MRFYLFYYSEDIQYFKVLPRKYKKKNYKVNVKLCFFFKVHGHVIQWN